MAILVALKKKRRIRAPSTLMPFMHCPGHAVRSVRVAPSWFVGFVKTSDSLKIENDMLTLIFFGIGYHITNSYALLFWLVRFNGDARNKLQPCISDSVRYKIR